MDPITLAIIAIVGLLVLFLVVKFITGCLPKLLLLAVVIVLAYLAWRYFTQ